MNLGELVKTLKRTSRYGNPNDTGDQITLDILRYINMRGQKIWRAAEWDWSFEEISFTQAAGVADKTLDATIGNIDFLSADGGPPLKAFTRRTYQQWIKNHSVELSSDDTGEVFGYIKLGRDTSNGIKIRFVRTPSAAVAITGWGKTRLTEYEVADIASNTSLSYFPLEFHDILFQGALADCKKANNDTSWEKEDRGFEAELKSAKGEGGSPDEDLDIPPPDYIRWVNRRRGGSTVV